MDTIIVWFVVALAVVFVVRRFVCGRSQGCGCGCSGGCSGGCDGSGEGPGRPLNLR